MNEFTSGDLVWAKINRKYWPGIIVDPHIIGKHVKTNFKWVYWFGDRRVSLIRNRSVIAFNSLFERYRYSRAPFNEMGKRCISGMMEALRIYKSQGDLMEMQVKLNSDAELVQWAFDGFQGQNRYKKNVIPRQILYEMETIKNAVESESGSRIKYGCLKDLKHETLGQSCIACYIDEEIYFEHPLFIGGLCFDCKEHYIKSFFMIGTEDKVHYCCAICGCFGILIVCSNFRCGLCYCYECIDNLGSIGLREFIINSNRWNCFVCSLVQYPKTNRLIKCRPNWREKLYALFNTHRKIKIPPLLEASKKQKIRVLSLFDGICTGLLALKQLGLEVAAYFAIEVDYNAKMLVKHHHPEVQYIGSGDVRELNAEKLSSILPIHLVVGGSPCNDLSMANPLRKGLFEYKGSGILIFEYCRIIRSLKQLGNDKFFWLYENVASMPNECKNIVSRFLECEPTEVNSISVSPQNRMRYFWGNCPSLHINLCFDGNHSLQDYLAPGRIATVRHIRTITTNCNSLLQGSDKKPAVVDQALENSALQIDEIEKIFGVPVGYTKYGNISRSARLILLGRAWCVQTICMLLHFLKYFYSTKVPEDNLRYRRKRITHVEQK